jgi:hypothetical protein
VDSGVTVTARIDGSGHQPHRHAASGHSGAYRRRPVFCRDRLAAGLAGAFVLTAIRIDERLARGTNTIAEWSPTYTPTILITRIVFWCVVLVGFLVGLEAFGASSDNLLTARLLGYIPNVVGAVVLLILGNVIARFLSRSVLIGAVNMNLHYARLLSLGIKWLVLVLTAAMVLDHLSIGAAIVDLAFGILFGGIVLALALAVGLGSRDLVSRSLEREAARPAGRAPCRKSSFRHF